MTSDILICAPRRALSIPCTTETPAPYRCNTGGPRSRTRSEEVHMTILGDPRRFGHWRCREVVGIAFPDGVNPRQWCLQLMEEAGWSSPEALATRLTVPRNALHVRPVSFVRADSQLLVRPRIDDRDRVLRAAVILGKCSDELYDPGRPVLWTNRALIRALALYETGDFYAD